MDLDDAGKKSVDVSRFRWIYGNHEVSGAGGKCSRQASHIYRLTPLPPTSHIGIYGKYRQHHNFQKHKYVGKWMHGNGLVLM